FTVADSDYTQREIFDVLGAESSLTLRELGTHAFGNYVWNDNASAGALVTWDAVEREGSFAYAGFVPDEGLGLRFDLQPEAGSFSRTVEGDLLTLTYESGLKLQGIDLPKGAFTATLNTKTGEYVFSLSNDVPITELGNWNQSTAIRFSVAVEAADAPGLVLSGKAFAVNIKGSNDVPTLSQVDAGGFVAQGIVHGAEGRVLSSESSLYKTDISDKDQVDYGTTSYHVLRQGAVNARGFNGSGKVYKQDAWLTSDGTKAGEIFSGDELVYSEKNLDAWMQAYHDYVEAHGMADTSFGGDAEKKGGFLSTPEYIKGADGVSRAEGGYGTLTLDETTGEYAYAADAASVQAAGGLVQETFSLLVTDHKGSFDIKDVTFLTVLDNDGEAHCFNGSPEMFSDGVDIAPFVQSAMAGDAAGGFALVPDAGDGVLQGADGSDAIAANDNDGAVLQGNDGADLLLGGAGGDVLDGGAGSDLLFGGGGCDLFVYDGAGDVLVDGGTGFDFLVGADGKVLEALQGALAGSAEAGEGRSGIANVEAAIQTERSLTSMADLGMQVGEDGQSVDLVSGWTSDTANAPMTLTATSDPDATLVTYRHCDDSGAEDAVMVAKVMFQTS
ncbi:MAG: VCBS domain-containing protein, partial [Desulfovibrio sp.]|nr:VCBS domain-containing protein [Desulfovibrio sp.]